MPRSPPRKAPSVAVGRDGRTHSPELEAALVEGLRAGGLDVVRIGLGPSPMLYFAVSTLDVDGGIQVTGSHNPSDYNGFKMLLTAARCLVRNPGPRPPRAEGDWSDGAGTVEEHDILDDYVDALVKGFDGKGYKIGWDAGNGAGGPASRNWSSACPASTIALHRGRRQLPTSPPDPTVGANLVDLKKLVADKGLDFGIAFDGDADRIGAIDPRGRVIWGDQVLIILAASGAEGLPARRSLPTSRPARPCSTASPKWAARR